MGRGADAVLDAHRSVHGVYRLPVIDAAIMPRLVSSNTNAPAHAVGERATAVPLAENSAAAVAWSVMQQHQQEGAP